ncbi:MAG: SusC/RagA family TonB-linked outer membrane protein [Dysgonamonadaceae bacterium]|jgi:TonB-linked SusC/RagA family outer membrane protein|nr:SusC/RagA family TonB-linked outer membrane protein [Dysgonamonadaceae bacterium]
MKKNLFLLFLVTCILGFTFPTLLAAQSQQGITLEMRQATIEQVVVKLKSMTDYGFTYRSSDLPKEKRDFVFRNLTIAQVMDKLVEETTLRWTRAGDVITILVGGKTSSALQQNLGKVTGRVTDENGDPLIGVTVVAKGTTKGVVTDADGRFELDGLSGGSVPLRITYIGKEAQEVTVKINSYVNIQLKDDVSQINQVVVTGYQTISREKSTGAVTTVNSAELAERYTPNIVNNLEGRVAGLVTYEGKTTIRGTGSLYATTSPLLVVDGLPVEENLEDINPYDVESITVLKDAAATAIYGARASNGIIVIKTKRATQRDRIDVDVSANFTIYQKRDLDYARNFYMTPEQQIKTEQDYYQYYFFDNDGEVVDPIGTTEAAITATAYSAMSPIYYAYYQLAKGDISQSELDRRIAEYKQNNFAKEYADHALLNRFLQQYNISARTRSDNYQSNLVINFKRDNMGIRKADSNQMTIFYKGTYDIASWVTVNFSINSILAKSQSSNSAYATDPFNVPAYYRLLNDDGSYNYYSTSMYNIYNTLPEENSALRTMRFNHLDELSYDQTNTDRRNTRYHADLLFRILPELTVNTQFIYETNRQTETSYAEAESYIMRTMRNVYTVQSGTTYSYMIPENGGKLATVNTKGDHWTGRGQIDYNRNFGKHALNLLAGLEFRQTFTNGTRGLLLGYDDQLQTDATISVNIPALENLVYTSFFMPGYPAMSLMYNPYISSAIGTVKEQRHRYGSGYANATYTYDNRYNVFGSFRKDYADVYGLDTRFRGKPLWSVGIGWNLHNEAFLAEASNVNFLKMRASYGATGNIYQGATSHMTAASGFNASTKLPMSSIESPANSELKWEENVTTDIGVDFMLFDRLKGSLDWYHKKGKDIFSRKTLDPSKGFTSIVMNLAGLKNDGIEWTISYDWFKEKKEAGFAWNTALIGSNNKNKITEVESQATRASELISTPFKVGYPVSALFSYQFAGIDDQGQPTWYAADGTIVKAATGTGVDAMVYSGQSDPITVLGMENHLSYNGFSLNVLMCYYGGHKMRVLQANPTFGVPYEAIPSYFLNAWTPQNTETNVPGIGRYSAVTLGGETTYTDIYVQPADFLKIRNIVLGYDLPRTFFSKMGMRRAVLRFQIDNPKYLWVKNKVGIDPETRSLRTPSSYIIGMNINF